MRIVAALLVALALACAGCSGDSEDEVCGYCTSYEDCDRECHPSSGGYVSCTTSCKKVWRWNECKTTIRTEQGVLKCVVGTEVKSCKTECP